MAFGKKKQSVPDKELGAEELMKKYDRESNVRIWEGVPKQVIRYICAAFSVYCIYVTLFSTMMPEEKLNLFLGHGILINVVKCVLLQESVLYHSHAREICH